MMDRYLFPAIFEPGEQKGYSVRFPDLSGCVTEGDTLEEALVMAREALELHLYGMEEDGQPIPQPTPPQSVILPPGAFVTLVEVWMPPIRDEMANRAVKKTLTIPKWLNDLAEERHVNFSHLLQSSLRQYLGFPRYTSTKVRRSRRSRATAR